MDRLKLYRAFPQVQALRLRVGNHRVFFKETADAITIHRVRDRREAYR